jgi:hypothetical protein
MFFLLPLCTHILLSPHSLDRSVLLCFIYMLPLHLLIPFSCRAMFTYTAVLASLVFHSSVGHVSHILLPLTPFLTFPSPLVYSVQIPKPPPHSQITLLPGMVSHILLSPRPCRSTLQSVMFTNTKASSRLLVADTSLLAAHTIRCPPAQSQIRISFCHAP